MTVAGLVLAAGAGTRFGRPKAGVVLDGETLAARAAATLRRGGCRPVIVVLGAEVIPIPGADRIVVNDGWRSGMASSLQVGLAAVAAAGAEAVVVLLADQPGVGAEAVERLRAAHAAGAALARATYDGAPDHPVLLGAGHWAGIVERAASDEGARAYLVAHAGDVVAVPCDGTGDPGDVDTPADLPRDAGNRP